MLARIFGRLRPRPVDPVPAPLPPAADTYPASDEDIRIAALTVWGEARGETWDGKVAVAWVIRNRADWARAFIRRRGQAHPLFGDGTLEAACLAPMQFSAWNEGDPNRAFLTGEKVMGAADLAALADCRRAVVQVIGGTVPDPTAGSRHYHTLGVAPAWSRGKTAAAAIGTHRFFNDIA